MDRPSHTNVQILSSLLSVVQAIVPRVKGARRSQRFPVSVQARLRPDNAPNATWEKIALENLSLGGAFIHTATPLAPKSKVDLLVSLDGSGELELRARIIYARSRADAQSDYGLRFIDLSYDRYRSLIAFVNDREKALTIGAARRRRSRLA